MKKSKIQVIICDDHQLIIDGVKMLLSLSDHIDVVGEAKNGVQLIELLRTTTTDVILLDINMPEMDGITACKKVSSKYSKIGVVFLSMINQLGLVSVLKEAGARGYLLKNASSEEIEQAIIAVYNGEPYFDENVQKEDPNKGLKRSTRYLPKLTQREKEILILILKEYTSQEIASELFISQGTVDTHRRNLISKLGVKNTAGLVKIAILHNLV